MGRGVLKATGGFDRIDHGLEIFETAFGRQRHPENEPSTLPGGPYHILEVSASFIEGAIPQRKRSLTHHAAVVLKNVPGYRNVHVLNRGYHLAFG